jgi:NitT/TauT family transport system permease protein
LSPLFSPREAGRFHTEKAEMLHCLWQWRMANKALSAEGLVELFPLHRACAPAQVKDTKLLPGIACQGRCAAGFFIMKSSRNWYIIPISLLIALLLELLANGNLLRHSLVTLWEVLLGLVLGVSVAAGLGYALAKFDWLERLLSPYIVASQSVPVVAIAPLLVIWFGAGLLSKVLIAALIVFFPVLINTIVGLRSVPVGLRDLMRSLQATPWETFRLLEVPAALPIFLGGLRVGATLAVIGAVVGEFVGADRGLGFLVNLGRGLYDTALVFVAVFTLVTLAMLLYGAVVLIENRLLSWQKK